AAARRRLRARAPRGRVRTRRAAHRRLRLPRRRAPRLRLGGVFTLDELRAAAALVHATVPPTPQYVWPLLAAASGCEVWVKHENHTPIGAFKVRGGLVYLDELVRSGRPRGLVTATRGNHGQSIPFAAAHHGIPVTVLVPKGNSADKNRAMAAWG